MTTRRGALISLALSACAAPPAETTEGASATVASSTGASSTGASSTSAGETASSTGAPTGTTGEATTGEPLACNGHAALCERRYDEVVFPTTHNSFSARDAGFSQLNANHRRTLAAQLEDGVRGLLLDVTEDGGETALCHGPCGFGKIAHAAALADIAAFLDAHPREVLTIIYQDSVPPAAVEADFVAAGLDARVYTHAGGPFPTLDAMIAADTRLVVTAEVGAPPPDWYHHVWDLAWDTPYSYKSPDEFSCALNRGDTSNPLFLLNHWVNSEIDLPSEEDAAIVNAFEVLHGRAVQCMQEAGDLPNFVAVDFYEQGDLFAVVDALNGV